MSAPEPHLLLAGLRDTLRRRGIAYDEVIASFGQVPASEERAAGRQFTLRDHVRGLVLSQLSNQRPWGAIALNLSSIDRVFFGYDPDALESADPQSLISGLRDLRCGNRSMAAQMTTLSANVRTLRRIETDFGHLDTFVASAEPDVIADRLSRPGKYKLIQLGYTLALEYLRNVGIRAGKPDVHVRRAISGERLAYVEGYPTEMVAYRIVFELAREAGCNPTYLDNLLWLFCAQDYGAVCQSVPKCTVCAFIGICRYPQRAQV